MSQWSSFPVLTLCRCVFGCHVMQKGEAVCGKYLSKQPRFATICFCIQTVFFSLLAVNQHLNRRGRPYRNLTCCNLFWICILLYQRTTSWSKQQIQQSLWLWKMLTVHWTECRRRKKKSLFLTQQYFYESSICKDGGRIHYQQLGWNDNAHYTPISLHKAANGSNHGALINKTLYIYLKSIVNLSLK